MNTHTQTDPWIYNVVIMLGLIAVGTIILAIMNQSMPEILSALGAVAAGVWQGC